MISLVLSAAALAQSTDAIVQQAEGFSAQNFRPAIDSRTSLWTERSATFEGPTLTAQLLGMYTANPLVYEYVDGGDDLVLVSDVFQTELGAALHVGRLRIGALVPIFLASDGVAVNSGAGLGDIAAELKINALRDGDGPLGLALAGRALFPTATLDAPLGVTNLGWEAMAIADKQVDHVVVAANLGMRGGPSVQLENISLDDQFFYRAGLSYLFDTDARGGVSFDLAGQANLKDMNSAGAPLEGLLGAWGHVAPMLTLRAGLGTGLTKGIGSPDLRVLVGLAIDPAADHEPETVVEPTRLEIVVQRPDGKPVPGVKSSLAVADEARPGADRIETSVPPGTYTYTAEAPGYATLTAPIVVPAAKEHRVVEVMQPLPFPVTVKLVDTSQRPIDGEWSPDGTTWIRTQAGQTVTELPVGTYTLSAKAPDHIPGSEAFEVLPQPENVAVIELGVRARPPDLTNPCAIELKEEVKFDTASAAIRAESFPMLDEVAAILANHPEIRRVRVEGHTDSVGSEAYNLDLSQRRAASVVAYLKGRDIDALRMTSQGYGETRPIATNDTPEGRQQNRRVRVEIEDPVCTPPAAP